MARLALDLTQGITEFSSRIALKMLFGQFGEVAACWIPPLEHRGKEPAYVKFNRPEAAQAALEACNGGQLYLDGVRLTAEWRLAPARTQDSRDFDAKGSNLFTSRDLLRQHHDNGDDRDRHRERKRGNKKRSRSRDRKRSRSRSRSRRKRSRSRDRKRSKSRSRDRKRNDRSTSNGKGSGALAHSGGVDSPISVES